jgi:hypothetical protein
MGPLGHGIVSPLDIRVHGGTKYLYFAPQSNRTGVCRASYFSQKERV